MKIIYVTNKFYPSIGGVETHVYEIAKRMAKKNEVYVYTTDLKEGLKKEETIERIKVRRFPSFAPNNAYFFSPSLYWALRKENCDILHLHNYHAFPSYLAFKAMKNKTRKIIFTPHMHPTGSNRFRTFLHIFYTVIQKSLLDGAEIITCNSEFEKQIIIAKNKGLEKKIIIISNGVNIERFQKAKPFQFKRRLILYIGRLEKYKNVQLTIKAMQFLPKEYLFYALGNGPYKKELEGLIEKLELKDRVKILSGLSDKEIARWYQTCSLFVTLSNIESFGITVIEALASGKLVIVNEATALTEFPKRFPMSVIGVKANEISSEELAKIILKQAGKNTKENLNEYNWDKIVKQLEEVYRK